MDRMYFHEGNGLPLHHDGQEYRVLAALPGRASYASLAPWHASKPMIPREQWRECSWRQFISPILDQGQTSSCCGHATKAAFHRTWSISGQTDHAFSPWWPYGWCDRGQDAGAVVGDLIEAINQHGMACTGNLADGDLPAQWYGPDQLLGLSSVAAKAQRFKPQEAYHLQPAANVFDQIASAIQSGFMTVFGITVGTNFSQLANDGSVAPRVGVLGGHALHGCGLRFNQRLSAWQIETQNSWGLWGAAGFCWLGEEAFTNSGMVDAFALEAARQDPQEAANWPVARAA